MSIVAATTRSNRRLVGAEKIGVRVEKIINRYQVAKHFHLQITDNSFRYKRNSEKIEAEANLDGMYVIRTSVSALVLDDREMVKTYKSLSQVEQAFRCYKTMNAKNRVQPKLAGVSVSFDKLTTPTPLQQRALDLLGVSLIL